MDSFGSLFEGTVYYSRDGIAVGTSLALTIEERDCMFTSLDQGTEGDRTEEPEGYQALRLKGHTHIFL